MAYNNFNKGTGYIGSPYNFISFSDKVIPYAEKDAVKPPHHNAIDKELISGEITYRIESKTPIIIDDGNGNFWKNAYGKEAFPGSSVRGLIRTNMQILSLSSMASDIDDYSLMFRNVASGPKKQKERYATILGADQITINNGKKSQQMSILKKVRAGYVYNENGTYKIYDTCIDKIPIERPDRSDDVMNYYILSERKLAQDYIDSQKSRRPFSYPFFVEKTGYRTNFKTQHILSDGFTKEEFRGRVQYKGRKNSDYKPYAEPCSYNVNGKEVTAVDKPGKLKNEGYAVSTGSMQQKKAIYIIPAVDKTKVNRFPGDMYALPLTIGEDDLKSFQVDINKRETTLKTFGGKAAFDLPEKGQMRPVFYIYEGKRLYFGFTPRLRLFYDHTIKEGLPKAHTETVIDYTKAILGYTNSDENDSLKSRVSFGDAVIVNNAPENRPLCSEILSEPKPTSYLDYVTPVRGEGMSFNDNNFQLRGVKQYWLRNATYSNVPKGKENTKSVSSFRPLPENSVFEGKVRFHNLREDELGLLLWSLKLDGKSWMNIGKAKSFGFGNIVLSLLNVRKLDTSAAYDLSALTLNPYCDCDADTYIAKYKEVIKERLNGKDIEELPAIKDFFLMKNPKLMPDPSKIRFMSIDNREYQNRTKPLPDVKEVLGISKGSNATPSVATKKDNRPASQPKKTPEAESVTIPVKNEVPREKADFSKALKALGTDTFTVEVKEISSNKYIRFKVTVNGTEFFDRIDFRTVTCEKLEKSSLKSLISKTMEMKCVGLTEDNKGKWECIKINH